MLPTHWSLIISYLYLCSGFPGGSMVKNPPANAGDTGDTGSIPGLGRSPGGGNGNPLQYSCLENPMDRRAWWATFHGVLPSRLPGGVWSAIPRSLSSLEIHGDHKRVGHDLTTKQQRQHLYLLYFLHLELPPSTLLSQFIPILQGPCPMSSVAYFCYTGDHSWLHRG